MAYFRVSADEGSSASDFGTRRAAESSPAQMARQATARAASKPATGGIQSAAALAAKFGRGKPADAQAGTDDIGFVRF
jgi:hypothetical protein